MSSDSEFVDFNDITDRMKKKVKVSHRSTTLETETTTKHESKSIRTKRSGRKGKFESLKHFRSDHQITKYGVVAEKITCPICKRDLSSFSLNARQLHVDKCLNVNDAEKLSVCSFCGGAFLQILEHERSCGKRNRIHPKTMVAVIRKQGLADEDIATFQRSRKRPSTVNCELHQAQTEHDSPAARILTEILTAEDDLCDNGKISRIPRTPTRWWSKASQCDPVNILDSLDRRFCGLSQEIKVDGAEQANLTPDYKKDFVNNEIELIGIDGSVKSFDNKECRSDQKPPMDNEKNELTYEHLGDERLEKSLGLVCSPVEANELFEHRHELISLNLTPFDLGISDISRTSPIKKIEKNLLNSISKSLSMIVIDETRNEDDHDVWIDFRECESFHHNSTRSIVKVSDDSPPLIPQSCHLTSTPIRSFTPTKQLTTAETSIIESPMPDFESMSIDQLKAEMAKFGLKPFTRVKMIAKLKEVFMGTHVPRNERSDYVFNHNKKQSSVHRRELRASVAEMSFLLESSVHEDKSGSLEQRRTALVDTIRCKIDSVWYRKILMYEPVDIEEFHAVVNAHLKMSKKDLMKIMDELCVTFTMKSMRTFKKRGRKK
ncbi:hypothetical protein ACOME3_006309 [Neoechinorhynchus agilis]